jgi:hypothetical protein
MISSLLNTISKALKTLAEFLTVLLLGLIATLLIVLPWLLRTLALLGWLAGTFLLWLPSTICSASHPRYHSFA